MTRDGVKHCVTHVGGNPVQHRFSLMSRTVSLTRSVMIFIESFTMLLCVSKRRQGLQRRMRRSSAAKPSIFVLPQASGFHLVHRPQYRDARRHGTSAWHRDGSERWTSTLQLSIRWVFVWEQDADLILVHSVASSDDFTVAPMESIVT